MSKQSRNRKEKDAAVGHTVVLLDMGYTRLLGSSLGHGIDWVVFLDMRADWVDFLGADSVVLLDMGTDPFTNLT